MDDPDSLPDAGITCVPNVRASAANAIMATVGRAANTTVLKEHCLCRLPPPAPA